MCLLRSSLTRRGFFLQHSLFLVLKKYMQLIRKGQENTVYFTLREKQTLADPYFLFCFNNQVELNPKCFIAADVSVFPNRVNKFVVTETSGTETLTSGVVTLSETGDYEYAIYEQTSSTNLDPVNATNLVPLEIGLIRVVGEKATYKEYDGQGKTYRTYGE